MTDLAQKFANDALLLPREDRAELVEKLLQSLKNPLKKTLTDYGQRKRKSV